MSDSIDYGITNWNDPTLCSSGTPYSCKDIVIVGNELYASTISDNDRHPHDSDAWDNLGSVADILGMIAGKDDGYMLSMPYHHSCSDGCVTNYAEGDSVAVKIPLFNADGSEQLSECGDPLFETLIFTSLVDDNIDSPIDGAAANPATWTQGVSLVEFLTSAPSAADVVADICADPASVLALKSCLGVSDPVTYTWAETNGNDGDGVIEWTGTPSDGSAAQVISVAEPTVDTDTDTVFTGSTLDPVTGIVTQTFADADGNALASKSLDLSALISSEHPSLAAGTGVQVAFDATANIWTVTNTVADTNTFSTLAGGVLTLPDGQTYDLTDTNTFATLAGTVITFPDGSTIDAGVDTFATLSGSILTLAGGQTYDMTHTVDTDTSVTVVNNADGSQSLQNVDIDGNNVGTAVNIGKPYEGLLDCNGDAIDGGVVTCGPNDYIYAAMLPMGEATLIAPLNNDNLCDTPVVSLVSGSENNVSVALNADGTHTVTAIGDACADGTWSYDYETVCNGETQTATVSGYVDNAVQTHAFSTANETTVNLALVLASGGDYDIDWGDGVVDTVASGTANTHVYTSAYTGDVNVSFPSCSEITEFRSTAGRWDFDIGTLPSGLTYYNNQGQNTTSGDISTLPSGLLTYNNAGQNTTSGDISTLPSGLTYYRNTGDNTTSGDISTLPSGLLTYISTGQNTTSGDVGTLPSGLTYYNNQGQNTVTATSTAWSASATMRYFLQYGVASPLVEVDNMLVALANSVTAWAIEKTVDVAGVNAAPSATGTSAIPTISAAGATTILTN